MRLAIGIGETGPNATIPMDKILEAERLGVDSVWAQEAYGADTVTTLTWIGARTTRIKLTSHRASRQPGPLQCAVHRLSQCAQAPSR